MCDITIFKYVLDSYQITKTYLQVKKYKISYNVKHQKRGELNA